MRISGLFADLVRDARLMRPLAPLLDRKSTRRRQTVVRMPELPDDEGIYELLWLGELRAMSPRGLQIRAWLASDDAPELVSAWLPLDRLPLLQMGTRWQRQRPIDGYDLPISLVPDLIGPMEVVSLRQHLRECPGDMPQLSRVPGNTRVFRMSTSDQTEVVLPAVEMFRMHYLPDSRVLTSIVGGLSVRRRLTSRRQQAWIPERTGWSDQRYGGDAYIRVASFLQAREAFRLARVVMSSEGLDGLRRLHAEFQHAFATSKRTKRVHLFEIPALPAPYVEGATWTAHVRDLPRTADDRARWWVTRITAISAPPPWESITIENEVRPRPTGKGDRGDHGASARVVTRLDPLPKESTALGDSASDARFSLLRAAALTSTDHEAEAHDQLEAVTPTGHGSSHRDRVRRLEQLIDEASTQPSGSGGAGRPPIAPGSTEAPESGHLPNSDRDVRDAFDSVVSHLQALTEGNAPLIDARYLPNRDEAYSFEVPARTAAAAEARMHVILELCFGSRHVYLVDPIRKRDERFPVGVVRAEDLRQMDLESLRNLARHFEFQRRRGASWVTDSGLLKGWKFSGVRHPRLHASKDESDAFVLRLASAVVDAMLADAS